MIDLRVRASQCGSKCKNFANKIGINRKNMIKGAKGVGYAALGCVGLYVAAHALVYSITGAKYLSETAEDPYLRNGKQMEYLKKNAPEKYYEYLESVYRHPSIRNIGGGRVEYDFWHAAAAKVQDSLRVDSIAKAAYAKGLQAAKRSPIK